MKNSIHQANLSLIAMIIFMIWKKDSSNKIFLGVFSFGWGSAVVVPLDRSNDVKHNRFPMRYLAKLEDEDENEEGKKIPLDDNVHQENEDDIDIIFKDNSDDQANLKAEVFNETAYDADAMTKTDFLRNMLQDDNVKEEDEDKISQEAIVKRKKRGKRKQSKYRVVDNRDSLPFEVRLASPDPYTTGNQAKLMRKQTKQQDKSKSSNKKKLRKTDLSDRSLGSIGADIYREDDDGTFQKVMGKFQLDKSTNCGDMLEIGDKNFEVLRARCQYKYAGGQQFVMVRKILEVKEVRRIAEEANIKRQFEKEPVKNATDVIHPSEI